MAALRDVDKEAAVVASEERKWLVWYCETSEMGAVL